MHENFTCTHTSQADSDVLPASDGWHTVLQLGARPLSIGLLGQKLVSQQTAHEFVAGSSGQSFPEDHCMQPEQGVQLMPYGCLRCPPAHPSNQNTRSLVNPISGHGNSEAVFAQQGEGCKTLHSCVTRWPSRMSTTVHRFVVHACPEDEILLVPLRSRPGPVTSNIPHALLISAPCHACALCSLFTGIVSRRYLAGLEQCRLRQGGAGPGHGEQHQLVGAAPRGRHRHRRRI